MDSEVLTSEPKLSPRLSAIVDSFSSSVSPAYWDWIGLSVCDAYCLEASAFTSSGADIIATAKTSIEVWGYRSQPMLVCRFINRVVTASDSVDTSRMELQVLSACVGPQRTLFCP